MLIEKPLTMGEVAELLGVHQTTLNRYVRNGLIVKIPGTHKITRAELRRFTEEQQEPKDRRRGRYNVGQVTQRKESAHENCRRNNG